MNINYYNKLEKQMDSIYETNYTKGDFTNHDSIGCVLLNDKDEFLVFYHKKFNEWAIPMGKIDPGYTRINGMKKEMKEELNIDVVEYKEITHFPYKFKRGLKTINVTGYLYLITDYKGKIINNEPKKHSSMRWMKFEKLKDIDDKKVSPFVILLMENWNRIKHLNK